jgi:MHS family proline/betaine transporter-like MFS transporter
VTTTLSEDAVHSWGWRVPFLIGLFVGLAGLYIREHIPETHKNTGHAKGRSPVWEALRLHWPAVLRIGLLNVVNGIGFYIAFVFLVTYMQAVGGLSESAALEINTLNMLVLLAMFPLSGWLSDRVGRKPLLIAGIGGLLVLSWPLFWALDHSSPAWNFVGQLGFSIAIGLFGGALPVTMVEIAPRAVRCSAISVGYNLVVGLLGGLTPMVATWLIQRSHNDLAPAYLVMGAALTSLAVAVSLPEKTSEAAA